MSQGQFAFLADRGVVRVTGEDATHFLQGLITNDIVLLERQPAIHAGLLSPQGKILFEFIVTNYANGYLLDTAAASVPDLLGRLSLYKLRAKVGIDDASRAFRVTAIWGNGGPTFETDAVPDPRLADLGWRRLQGVDAPVKAAEWIEAGPEAYHAHRIALGVPEGGKDYVLGDTFPHEALFDQLNGISFDKGCFVGQEVVSRMEHRGTARKRIVPVEGAAALTTGAEVRAGTAVIGTVGSTAGPKGLALVRLDRAEEAIARGQGLTAGGVAIRLKQPAWARFKVPTAR